MAMMLLLLIMIDPSHPAFSSSSGSSKSSSSTAFSQFEFAPNGVCVKPALFVLVDTDAPPADADAAADAPSADASSSRHPNQPPQQQPRASFTLRNVPGQGDCIFLAVALASLCSVGLGANDVLLNALAKETRNVVATIFETAASNNHNTNSTLFVTGQRLVTATALLKSAARELQLSPKEYLRRLRLTGREGGLYGGGPELTVLANVLRRPISVYELAKQQEAAETERIPSSSSIGITCEGVFGAGIFDDPLLKVRRRSRHGQDDPNNHTTMSMMNSAVLQASEQAASPMRGAYSWHLHILVVDAGKEKHACVLLPQPPASSSQ